MAGRDAHRGCGIYNGPGAPTWEDLRSPDPDAARSFYTAVFGHSTQELPDAGPEYQTFALADDQAPLGGMGGMMGAKDQPAHWLVYFGVADLEAAVAAAEASGGSVLIRDLDTPYGSMAGPTDLAGATFWLIQTSDQPQPDGAG